MITSFFILFAMNTSASSVAKATTTAAPIPVHQDVESRLCDIHVSDCRLNTVLDTLSKQTHVNMVLLSDPGSKLALNLSQVPLGDMVQHLCALSGLNFLKVNGTYVFATDAKLKAGYPTEYEKAHPTPPPVPEVVPTIIAKSTEVYRTNYVNADSLANTIRALFDKKDLNITTGPEIADPFLSSLSTGEKTGTSATTVSSKDQRDQAAGSYGDSVKADVLNRSRTLLISGPTTLVTTALETIKKLDIPRRQVVIDVSVLETSNEVVRELGLSWTFGSMQVLERPVATSTTTTTRPLDLGPLQRTPLTSTATIKANELATRSRVLASPNVAVLDGESAFVLIGNRIKYSVLKEASTPQSAAVYDIQEDRVGIYLQVAPQIASDGTMILNLYPQVSTISGYLVVNGSSLPQISTREAHTVMRVVDGQTVVMGGLIQDSDQKESEKVPIFGDIPILGEFFKRHKRDKSASQLIISITPHIIEVERLK